MAKNPIFPQRVKVVNAGLSFTRLTDDEAILNTDLGQVRVPLAWWLAHRKDPAFVLVVTAVEALPQHVGATLAREERKDG
jgi:hypothetical protein